MLLIEDSLDLQCRQYLASALCPSHPSHAIVTQSSDPLIKKNTLQSKYLESVRPFLTDNNPTPDQIKIAQTNIHTKAVQDAILNTPPNRVLQEPAPQISPEELNLPRAYRTTLSQLRSGHCIALNDFRAAIGLTADPSCTACGSGDLHTVPHLFSCPAHPTELVARDLWERLVQTAHFLSSIPSFHHLCALPPPPLEPPPVGTRPLDAGPLTPAEEGKEKDWVRGKTTTTTRTAGLT